MINKNFIFGIIALFAVIFSVASFATPDFTVTAIRAQGYDVYNTNQTVMFEIDYANIGDAADYTNIAIDFGDGTVLTKSFNFEVDAGFDSTILIGHQYKNYGNYLVKATIDPQKLSAESSFANNVATKQVSLIQPTYNFDVALDSSYNYSVNDSNPASDETINFTISNKGNQGLTVTLEPQNNITSNNGKTIIVNADSNVGVSPGNTGVIQYTLKNVDSSKAGKYEKMLVFTNQIGQSVSKDLIVNIIDISPINNSTNQTNPINQTNQTTPVNSTNQTIPITPIYNFNVNMQNNLLYYVGLNVTSTPQNIIVPISITNNGNQNFVVNISSSQNITASNGNVIMTSFPQGVALNINQSQNIGFTLKNVYSANIGNYTTQIFFTNNNGETLEEDFNISIQNPSTTLTVSSSGTSFTQENRNSLFSGSFTIQNNGPTQLTNVMISACPSCSGYTISPSTINLTVGEVQTISFTKNISADASSGTFTEPIYIQNPMLNMEYTYNVQYSIDSMLEFGNIKYSIDGASQKTLSSNINLKPNSAISFQVQLENLFTQSNSDRVTIYAPQLTFDIDSGLEIDAPDVSADNDIKAGDKNTVTFSFDKIPFDVSTGTYNVKMHASGQDSNGASQSAEKDFTITIQKQAHSVTFDSAGFFSGDSIKESDLPTQIEIYVDNICNIGSTNENLNLDFESSRLGISDLENISLDRDSECFTNSYTFDVANVPSGTYPITVSLSNNNVNPITKTVNLQILGNPDDAYRQSQNISVTPNTIVTPTQNIPTESISNQTTSNNNLTAFGIQLPGLTLENVLIVVLIVGIGVLLVLIIVIGIKIGNAKSEPPEYSSRYYSNETY